MVDFDLTSFEASIFMRICSPSINEKRHTRFAVCDHRSVISLVLNRAHIDMIFHVPITLALLQVRRTRRVR